MSPPRSPDVPEYLDPLDVAAECRARAEAEGVLAAFVEADTDAGAALRAYLWHRQVAWAESALTIERAARGHTHGRFAHAVRLLAHRAAEGRHGASGPVFATVAALLGSTLENWQGGGRGDTFDRE